MKEYKRGPLSLQYRDMEKPEQDALDQSMIDNGFLKSRPIITRNGLIEDGWQRHLSAIRTGTKAVYKEWKDEKDGDLDLFVYLENGVHRHLSPAEFAARVSAARDARSARIAELRMAGDSLRTIAEKENVSVPTVVADLEKEATVRGVDSVHPEDGKVTGKDGRDQPAARPESSELLCHGCGRRQRLNIDGGKPIPNCQDCKSKRKEAAAADKRKADIAAAKAAKTTPPPKPEKPGKPPKAPTEQLTLIDQVIDFCLLKTKTSSISPEDSAWNRALEEVATFSRNLGPVKKAKAPPIEIPATLDTPAFREAWATWVQHRKEKKSPLKDTAVKLQMKQLTDMGAERATAALIHSATQGYTGIYEAGQKESKNGQQRKSDPGSRYDPNYKYGGSEKEDAGKPK